MPIDPLTGLEQVKPTQPTPIQPAQQPQPVTQPQLPQPVTQPIQPGVDPGAFTFDPNKYLPGIQQTAASIYNPQIAQIQALQQLGKQQTETAKVTTQEQFDKELQARIEAINARGAFFGGGAIDQQNQIGTNRTRALTALDLQQQANEAANQAQLAGLSAQQAQYVRDQLTSAQGSAYSQWRDQYSMYQDRLNREFQQQQAAQSQANADREYKLRLKEIKENKKLTKTQRKSAEKEAKRAKQQFDAELAYKYAALNNRYVEGSSQYNSNNYIPLNIGLQSGGSTPVYDASGNKNF